MRIPTACAEHHENLYHAIIQRLWTEVEVLRDEIAELEEKIAFLYGKVGE